MSDLRKTILSRTPGKPPTDAKMSRGRFNDFTPIPWSEVFAEKVTAKIEADDGRVLGEYCVYLRHKPSEAKSFDPTQPTIVFLHGCGHSGLTWGETILETDQYMADVQMAAIDLRGHGLTKTNDDYNLDFDVLISSVPSWWNIIDLLQVFSKVELDTHPLVLVGHSMGGALAITLAEHIEQEPVDLKILALFIIDIVEGSAVDALPSMKPLIRSRPTGFESVEKAIEWTLKTGQVRSQYSARFSVLGQLQKATDTEEGANGHSNSASSIEGFKIPGKVDAIVEEDESDAAESEASSSSSGRHESPNADFKQPTTSAHNYTWRIDVMKTEKFWLGWFTGMSKRFLRVECPKYLLLANVDRLDKELTIAQMQGKFQMSCIQDVGHAVQEDKPDQVGLALSNFLIRHRIAKSRTGSSTSTFPGVV